MLRYLYSDGGLCIGVGLLLLPLAGELHQRPDWKRGSTLSLSNLALTTHTQSCTPGGLLHTSLQPDAFLEAEAACRKRGTEQGNFTLAFDLHDRRRGSSLHPALQGA